MNNQQFDEGLAKRKQVMRNTCVGRAFGPAVDFNGPLQKPVACGAWRAAGRPDGLEMKTLSLSEIFVLAALGRV